MIRRIEISNFKSIVNAKLDLGRVNVFIGENGSGKSNLLEALAFASAASSHHLDNEFLASRGIRSTPGFMRPAFEGKPSGEVKIHVEFQDTEPIDLSCRWTGSEWSPSVRDENYSSVTEAQPDSALVEKTLELLSAQDPSIEEFLRLFKRQFANRSKLAKFLIYSPENTALRTFQAEGQILPLGVHGEGLFAHLRELARDPERAETIAELSERLQLIGWFKGFSIPSDLGATERRLDISDVFLPPERSFDQRAANEGFLFLLFYFLLFLSKDTPKVFAIDNVDASLNPKLCTRLMTELVELAEQSDKQVLLTTHNPALLDGLDLTSEEARLFVVRRDSAGHTRVRRARAPSPLGDEPTLRLSEAFVRGMLGGLPKGF